MCIQDGKEHPKLGEAEVQEIPVSRASDPHKGKLVGSDPQIEHPDVSTKKYIPGVNGQEIKCKICYQELSKKDSVVIFVVVIFCCYFFIMRAHRLK